MEKTNIESGKTAYASSLARTGKRLIRLFAAALLLCAAMGRAAAEYSLPIDLSCGCPPDPAGFGEGWVKMLELNPAIAPAGSIQMRFIRFSVVLILPQDTAAHSFLSLIAVFSFRTAYRRQIIFDLSYMIP